MDIDKILFEISVWTIPVILAVTFHEAAHGWVASKLGDNTAKMLGRVTFNPVKHVDVFGTLILPALLLFLSGGRMMLGYAKPVPVDFSRLNHPRRDMVLVAAAGPAANLILAFVAAALIHTVPLLSGDVASWVMHNLKNALWINLILCIFNMLPIPPLDGGRVAVGLLPAPLAIPLARLEPAGFAIILGVVFLLPILGNTLGMNINVFWWLVGAPAAQLQVWIVQIMGLV
ncbi:MAG: site-2 protease family protein [Rhodospirillaceae bacterium]